jgi:hypothetical protein
MTLDSIAGGNSLAEAVEPLRDLLVVVRGILGSTLTKHGVPV